MEFLQFLEFRSDYPKFYFVTIEDEFPSDWITETQVDSLILYVKSKDKAYCFVNPLSSNIPTDTAQLGGHAIKLIVACKEKVALDAHLNLATVYAQTSWAS